MTAMSISVSGVDGNEAVYKTLARNISEWHGYAYDPAADVFYVDAEERESFERLVDAYESMAGGPLEITITDDTSTDD